MTIAAMLQGRLVSYAIPNYKKRQWLVGAASVAVYGGSLISLNQAWYKAFPRSSFHTFNDAGEWLQIDKVGHAWSAYSISRVTTAAWQWAGLPHKKSVLVGSATGFAYLSVIEVLDAHSNQWGWSWADMGSNLFGSGLFAAQELAWKEQKVQFKFSSHRKQYDAALQERADNLFGASLPERILKDYNGQTYWASFNLNSLFKNSQLPPWLNIAVGYGGDGLWGGFENKGFDESGNVIFNRTDIPRRRQWYLSPDIDFTKIKTDKKLLKTLFAGLNAIKMPAPALMYSGGKWKGYLIYF